MTRRALICLAFLMCLLPRAGWSQAQYVYLVKANDCAQAPAKRALTGFRLRGIKGVITALHGVADSPNITLFGLNSSLKDASVRIYDVDVAHDLARLSSPELEALPAEGLTIAPEATVQARGKASVLGYPLGLSETLEVPLTIGTPPHKLLKSLLPPKSVTVLAQRKSPLPTLDVLYLLGPLHPGHSGAPVLDSEARVIGIGNGGLVTGGGGSGIGWAVTLKGLAWKPLRSAADDMKRLKDNPANGLFAFESDADGAEKRVDTLQEDLEKLIKLLEEELKLKEEQKDFLRQQAELSGAEPVSKRDERITEIPETEAQHSDRAKEIAAKIPRYAGDYAAFLRSIIYRAKPARVADAASFRFRVVKCKAVNTQVVCELEVINRTPEDRTLYIASRQKGGIANTSLRVLGITSLIDDKGATYQAESLTFANQSGAETGQSYFTVYSNTTPTLRIVFDNVPLSADTVRLDLSVGEAVSNGMRGGVIHLRGIPVERDDSAAVGAPARDREAAERFVVEALSWRFTLKEPQRDASGVFCILTAANLSDTRNLMYLNWQGKGGIRATYRDNENSTAIDSKGVKYPVDRLFVQGKNPEREIADNGQTILEVEPNSEIKMRIHLRGVPQNISRLARLDLILGYLPNPGGKQTRVPARFSDIPITATHTP